MKVILSKIFVLYFHFHAPYILKFICGGIHNTLESEVNHIIVLIRLLVLLVSNTFIYHFLFRYMVLSADSKIKVSEGSPDNMPDEKSYEAAMQIQNLISKLKEKEILIVLISGMVNLLLVKYMYCCFIFRVFNIQGQ